MADYTPEQKTGSGYMYIISIIVQRQIGHFMILERIFTESERRLHGNSNAISAIKREDMKRKRVRDYIHVVDLVDGHIAALCKLFDGSKIDDDLHKLAMDTCNLFPTKEYMSELLDGSSLTKITSKAIMLLIVFFYVITRRDDIQVLTEKRRNYQGKRFLSAEDDELINQFLSLPITRDPYLCIGEKWINAWQIRDVLFKLELEDDALDIYFGILEDEQSPTKWYYVSSWAQKTLKDSHPLLEDAASAESYMNTLTGFFRGCTTTTLMDLDMVLMPVHSDFKGGAAYAGLGVGTDGHEGHPIQWWGYSGHFVDSGMRVSGSMEGRLHAVNGGCGSNHGPSIKGPSHPTIGCDSHRPSDAMNP
ncbi:UDP-glucose 4-epimerase 2 [Acorus calamus]|uniref:UDP-glucose 4-epimerase 2 n=1 Tax=Acorus calamus TaxID=4465 RepID=A0AAV9D4C8_ACOCL|nr:UDP-glucose 4-epimerase 2 [Acorus calamus]